MSKQLFRNQISRQLQIIMERLHIIILAQLFQIHRHLKIIVLLIKRAMQLIKQIVQLIQQAIRIKQVIAHPIVPLIVPQTIQPNKTQQQIVRKQIVHQLILLILVLIHLHQLTTQTRLHQVTAVVMLQIIIQLIQIPPQI